MKDSQVPKQHLALSDPARISDLKPTPIDLGPTLTEAMEIYIRLKGHQRPKTFLASSERACRYLIEARGNKHLLDYTKKDATSFRDALLERGMNGNSISRVFGTIKAITTFAANEHGLTLVNPFVGVYFDTNAGATTRQPIPVEDIRVIQKNCFDRDDDMRWLVALVADTGLRLAEVAGILVEDIHLNENIPFVRVQPHPWRRLKTESSARDVPLVGSSLWAAQRITQTSDKFGFAFRRYNMTDTTNANSASAALNKWLKQHINKQYTMHGFRHSMRDRLRSVQCPTEIADQIGGWSSSSSVGQSYGSGYSLGILHKWLADAVDHTECPTLQL